MLAGTVETAVNALWDAAPLVGDRVTVVGAGMVGCCVAALLARFPGVGRRAGRRRPGPGRRSPRRSASTSPRPADAAGGRDLVVHASATAAGLQRSLDLLAPEGTVLELSWYGDRPVQLSLGGAFHSGRLTHPQQPGRHGVARPAGRTAATPTGWRSPSTCSRDPAFDALITGAVPRSTSCPTCWPGWPSGDLPALCHLITYDERVTRVQRDRPRPHDDRPQLPRRGLRPGAAAARRDVRRRRDVPPGRAGRRRHRGRHRRWPPSELRRRAGRAELPQPRRRAGVRRA